MEGVSDVISHQFGRTGKRVPWTFAVAALGAVTLALLVFRWPGCSDILKSV